jgi:hypothetical protein
MELAKRSAWFRSVAASAFATSLSANAFEDLAVMELATAETTSSPGRITGTWTPALGPGNRRRVRRRPAERHRYVRVGQHGDFRRIRHRQLQRPGRRSLDDYGQVRMNDYPQCGMQMEMMVPSSEPAVGVFTTDGTCPGRLWRHLVIGYAAA